MRILTLDYESNLPGSLVPLKGGTARFARDFSKSATSKGHTWLGILQRRDLEESKWELISKEPNKEFYGISSGAMKISEVAAHDSLAQIEQTYQRELDTLREVIVYLKPDVLFLNGFSQYSWLLYKAAKKEGVPICMQHAGLWVRDLEAFAAYCPPGYQEIAKEMEREATECVSINIFLNDYSEKALMQDLGINRVPGSTIIPLPHAGWDFIGEFVPRNNPLRKIGIVARWDRIKNHDAVLALGEEILRRNLPWKLSAVTTIPETPARAAFKKRYKEVIEVVPPMDREALHTFFETLDVAILPSHFETAGGVVMEAVAVGVPTLISPSVGWVSEYTSAGMQDWVVDFTNPAGVVDMLESQFARDSWPEVRAFADDIKTKHDPEIVFSTYLSQFAGLVSNVS